MPDGFERQDDALLQFLYRVPVGLLQTRLDGTIEMINPNAARLLMPLARTSDLDNLFVVLEDLAPQLGMLTEAFEPASGVICDALRVSVPATVNTMPRILSIGLMKLDGSRLMAVLSDATVDAQRESREMQLQLRHAARVDKLTEMPNRTALLEQVRDVLEREPIDAGYEFAVLFMNCDRFAQINDSFGRQAGDEVLAVMAGRLRAALRPRDRVGRAGEVEQMAARVNGDEFVVLLEDLRNPGDVHVVASRLIEALSKPYAIGERQLFCSVSMGIVLRAHADGDADAVLQDASMAMGEAKRAGGARYALFEPIMRERAVRRGGIEAELRHALDSDELFVVYQPVVDLTDADGSEGTAGVEALVRWKHPVRGVVPPIEFIGIAEESGLIGALGNFVLATACRQFVTWREAHGARAPRLLAVNLSRAQLGIPDFVASVRDVLQATGMPASQLQLEVTESLAAQDESVQARLVELKALGITLALDDFGTGYSSLSSLHRLPVDTVKIDRSFVSLIDVSAHHRVLIEATVHVAKSLGMGTVAEGIETEAQASVIREAGCEKGQGYLFSRPLEAEQLSGWLEARPA